MSFNRFFGKTIALVLIFTSIFSNAITYSEISFSSSKVDPSFVRPEAAVDSIPDFKNFRNDNSSLATARSESRTIIQLGLEAGLTAEEFNHFLGFALDGFNKKKATPERNPAQNKILKFLRTSIQLDNVKLAAYLTTIASFVRQNEKNIDQIKELFARELKKSQISADPADEIVDGLSDDNRKSQGDKSALERAQEKIASQGKGLAAKLLNHLKNLEVGKQITLVEARKLAPELEDNFLVIHLLDHGFSELKAPDVWTKFSLEQANQQKIRRYSDKIDSEKADGNDAINALKTVLKLQPVGQVITLAEAKEIINKAAAQILTKHGGKVEGKLNIASDVQIAQILTQAHYAKKTIKRLGIFSKTVWVKSRSESRFVPGIDKTFKDSLYENTFLYGASVMTAILISNATIFGGGLLELLFWWGVPRPQWLGSGIFLHSAVATGLGFTFGFSNFFATRDAYLQNRYNLAKEALTSKIKLLYPTNTFQIGSVSESLLEEINFYLKRNLDFRVSFYQPYIRESVYDPEGNSSHENTIQSQEVKIEAVDSKNSRSESRIEKSTVDGYDVFDLSLDEKTTTRISTLGANPISLILNGKERVWHKGNGKKLVGEDGRPLPGGIPFMFPWTSRIHNGKFFVNGKEVDLKSYPEAAKYIRWTPDAVNGPNALHGMTDKMQWKVIDQHAQKDNATITLALDTKDYPILRDAFGFGDSRVTLIYTLSEGRLSTSVSVANNNQDGRTIAFSFGSHPFYLLDGDMKDWEVENDASKTWEVDANQVPLYQDAIPNKGTVVTRLDHYIEQGFTSLNDLTAKFRNTKTGEVFNVFQSRLYKNRLVWVPFGKPGLEGVASIQPITSAANALNLDHAGITADLVKIAAGKTETALSSVEYTSRSESRNIVEEVVGQFNKVLNETPIIDFSGNRNEVATHYYLSLKLVSQDSSNIDEVAWTGPRNIHEMQKDDFGVLSVSSDPIHFNAPKIIDHILAAFKSRVEKYPIDDQIASLKTRLENTSRSESQPFVEPKESTIVEGDPVALRVEDQFRSESREQLLTLAIGKEAPYTQTTVLKLEGVVRGLAKIVVDYDLARVLPDAHSRPGKTKMTKTEFVHEGDTLFNAIDNTAVGVVSKVEDGSVQINIPRSEARKEKKKEKTEKKSKINKNEEPKISEKQQNAYRLIKELDAEFAKRNLKLSGENNSRVRSSYYGIGLTSEGGISFSAGHESNWVNAANQSSIGFNPTKTELDSYNTSMNPASSSFTYLGANPLVKIGLDDQNHVYVIVRKALLDRYDVDADGFSARFENMPVHIISEDNQAVISKISFVTSPLLSDDEWKEAFIQNTANLKIEIKIGNDFRGAPQRQLRTEGSYKTPYVSDANRLNRVLSTYGFEVTQLKNDEVEIKLGSFSARALFSDDKSVNQAIAAVQKQVKSSRSESRDDDDNDGEYETPLDYWQVQEKLERESDEERKAEWRAQQEDEEDWRRNNRSESRITDKTEFTEKMLQIISGYRKRDGSPISVDRKYSDVVDGFAATSLISDSVWDKFELLLDDDDEVTIGYVHHRFSERTLGSIIDELWTRYQSNRSESRQSFSNHLQINRMVNQGVSVVSVSGGLSVYVRNLPLHKKDSRLNKVTFEIVDPLKRPVRIRTERFEKMLQTDERIYIQPRGRMSVTVGETISFEIEVISTSKNGTDIAATAESPDVLIYPAEMQITTPKSEVTNRSESREEVSNIITNIETFLAEVLKPGIPMGTNEAEARSAVLQGREILKDLGRKTIVPQNLQDRVQTFIDQNSKYSQFVNAARSESRDNQITADDSAWSHRLEHELRTQNQEEQRERTAYFANKAAIDERNNHLNSNDQNSRSESRVSKADVIDVIGRSLQVAPSRIVDTDNFRSKYKVSDNQLITIAGNLGRLYGTKIPQSFALSWWSVDDVVRSIEEALIMHALDGQEIKSDEKVQRSESREDVQKAIEAVSMLTITPETVAMLTQALKDLEAGKLKQVLTTLQETEKRSHNDTKNDLYREEILEAIKVLKLYAQTKPQARSEVREAAESLDAQTLSPEVVATVEAIAAESVVPTQESVASFTDFEKSGEDLTPNFSGHSFSQTTTQEVAIIGSALASRFSVALPQIAAVAESKRPTVLLATNGVQAKAYELMFAAKVKTGRILVLNAQSFKEGKTDAETVAKLKKFLDHNKVLAAFITGLANSPDRVEAQELGVLLGKFNIKAFGSFFKDEDAVMAFFNLGRIILEKSEQLATAIAA